MARTYGFHPFDWSAYRALVTPLSGAYRSGDFGGSQLAVAQPILAELEPDLPPEAICIAVVLELCCLRSGIVFHGTLLDELRAMRRTGSVDAAEALTDLVLSGMNLPDWCRADSGLAGVLTEQQTVSLAQTLRGASSRASGAAGPAGFRKLVLRLTGHEIGRDMLGELAQLVAWSAQGGYGLAAVAA